MSNENQNDDTGTNPTGLSELDLLRQQATQLGISFSGNTGTDTLKAKIKAKLEDKPAPPADPPSDPTPVAKKEETEQERNSRIRAEVQSEGMKMVRIRIACMNPDKAQLHGEIITVQNKFLGTVKKYVPFGEESENGYHVPHCIYEVLRDRQFNQVTTRKKGQNSADIVVIQKMVREFNIEILPALTKDELTQLAAAQAAKGGISD